MFVYEMKCPKCGESFTHDLLKFRPRHICDQCGQTTLVEMKIMMTLIETVVLLIVMQLFLFTMESIEIKMSIPLYILLFVILMLLYYLICGVLVKIFGIDRVYRLTNFETKRKK